AKITVIIVSCREWASTNIPASYHQIACAESQILMASSASDSGIYAKITVIIVSCREWASTNIPASYHQIACAESQIL
ncbi:hypothetical protein, partial [Escherichia coli]|uniref:hypothetical protein n=1 Tax=Escherichia coli TaxID=562 RepID=UPI001BC8B6CC